jgi:ABC-type sugar transport system ATPase subunit
MIANNATSGAAGTCAAKVVGVDKRFGGAHALRGVSITFEKGDVHAIAGENGAGKSTLMKILSGVIGDYTGAIEIDGVRHRFDSIRVRYRPERSHPSTS